MDLPKLFRHYLQLQKASPVTVKNYVADINHFLTWLNQETGIRHQVAGKAISDLFTLETIEEYKSDLLDDDTPPATINRRLSALRKFGRFSQSQGWIEDNEALKVKNISQTHLRGARSSHLGGGRRDSSEVLRGFQKRLEKEKASKLTIKNYLSDLRHFLGWLEAS